MRLNKNKIKLNKKEIKILHKNKMKLNKIKIK